MKTSQCGERVRAFEDDFTCDGQALKYFFTVDVKTKAGAKGLEARILRLDGRPSIFDVDANREALKGLFGEATSHSFVDTGQSIIFASGFRRIKVPTSETMLFLNGRQVKVTCAPLVNYGAIVVTEASFINAKTSLALRDPFPFSDSEASIVAPSQPLPLEDQRTLRRAVDRIDELLYSMEDARVVKARKVLAIVDDDRLRDILDLDETRRGSHRSAHSHSPDAGVLTLAPHSGSDDMYVRHVEPKLLAIRQLCADRLAAAGIPISEPPEKRSKTKWFAPDPIAITIPTLPPFGLPNMRFDRVPVVASFARHDREYDPRVATEGGKISPAQPAEPLALELSDETAAVSVARPAELLDEESRKKRMVATVLMLLADLFLSVNLRGERKTTASLLWAAINAQGMRDLQKELLRFPTHEIVEFLCSIAQYETCDDNASMILSSIVEKRPERLRFEDHCSGCTLKRVDCKEKKLRTMRNLVHVVARAIEKNGLPPDGVYSLFILASEKKAEYDFFLNFDFDRISKVFESAASLEDVCLTDFFELNVHASLGELTKPNPAEQVRTAMRIYARMCGYIYSDFFCENDFYSASYFEAFHGLGGIFEQNLFEKISLSEFRALTLEIAKHKLSPDEILELSAMIRQAPKYDTLTCAKCMEYFKGKDSYGKAVITVDGYKFTLEDLWRRIDVQIGKNQVRAHAVGYALTTGDLVTRMLNLKSSLGIVVQIIDWLETPNSMNLPLGESFRGLAKGIILRPPSVSLCKTQSESQKKSDSAKGFSALVATVLCMSQADAVAVITKLAAVSVKFPADEIRAFTIEIARHQLTPSAIVKLMFRIESDQPEHLRFEDYESGLEPGEYQDSPFSLPFEEIWDATATALEKFQVADVYKLMNGARRSVLDLGVLINWNRMISCLREASLVSDLSPLSVISVFLLPDQEGEDRGLNYVRTLLFTVASRFFKGSESVKFVQDMVIRMQRCDFSLENMAAFARELLVRNTPLRKYGALGSELDSIASDVRSGKVTPAEECHEDTQIWLEVWDRATPAIERSPGNSWGFIGQAVRLAETYGFELDFLYILIFLFQDESGRDLASVLMELGSNAFIVQPDFMVRLARTPNLVRVIKKAEEAANEDEPVAIARVEVLPIPDRTNEGRMTFADLSQIRPLRRIATQDDGNCLFNAAAYFLGINGKIIRYSLGIQGDAWSESEIHFHYLAMVYNRPVFVISRDYRQISEKFSHIDRTDPVQLQTARLELEDLSQNTEGHAIFGESVRCYRSDGTVRPTSAAEMATAIEPDDIVLYSRVDPNANPLEQHIESIDFFSKRARSHHVSEKATEMAQRAFAVGKHFDDKRSSAAASKDK